MKYLFYTIIFSAVALLVFSCEKKEDTKKLTTVSIASVREEAEDVFSKGKFYCSEAVVYSINNVLKEPYPDNITKAASAFPVGLGKAKSLCGAVSGGEIALGLVYGRTFGQEMHPKMLPFAKELHDYIKNKYGTVICSELVAPYDFKSDARKKLCVSLTGDVTDWVAKKIASDTLEVSRFSKEETAALISEELNTLATLNCKKCPNRGSCQ